jgi:hypothetical protein
LLVFLSQLPVELLDGGQQRADTPFQFVDFLAYRVAPPARGIEFLLERVQARAQLSKLCLGVAVGNGRGDQQQECASGTDQRTTSASLAPWTGRQAARRGQARPSATGRAACS